MRIVISATVPFSCDLWGQKKVPVVERFKQESIHGTVSQKKTGVAIVERWSLVEVQLCRRIQNHGNGNQFVPRDHVFPLLVVYFLKHPFKNT